MQAMYHRAIEGLQAIDQGALEGEMYHRAIEGSMDIASDRSGGNGRSDC